MPDLLGISTSGLMAYQAALSTTGHNISNVNTEGYSRQRAQLATRIPEPTGAGYFGSGVQVTTVERMYSQFATEQVRTQTSLNSYLDSYAAMAMQVDNLLANPDAGLAPALQNFFDAMQGVADNPSSIPSRQVLLSEAGSMVDRFQSIESRLSDLRDSVNARVENLVMEINGFADSIAKLNYDIVIARDLAGGQPPNDLLDQRDELIRQLAERIPVTTVPQDNGALNVFVGSGEVLVLGSDPRGISVGRNEFDAFRYEITTGRDGTGAVISRYIEGGDLGGVLNFRSQMLEPTMNSLGKLALGLADVMNQQHQQGLTLDGVLGGELFNVPGLNGQPIIAAAKNPSSPMLEVYISDVSRLTTDEYKVETGDGVTFKLIRQRDGAVLDTFPNVAGTYVSATEGFTLNLTGAAVAGDSYLIQPTRAASRNISLEVNNVRDIAAASPMRSREGSYVAGKFVAANLGDATITPPTVLDVTDPNFFTTVTIEADDSDADGAVDRYTLDGGTTWTVFAPGGDVVVSANGWEVTLSGTMFDGDTFTVERNTDAVGDNGNALLLADLQHAAVLDRGSNTFQTAYGQMVSGVGADTHQLDVKSKAQSTILQQAVAVKEGISGVNLDEEAANLIRFQQAYQANAQVINAAQTLFQTLLDAVRR